MMQTSEQREIPESSDTLGETLYSLRLNGMVYANSELSAPWGVAMPPMQGKMMFHIVTQGGCWLRFPDHDDVYLRPGELALLPKGEGHSICSSNDIKCQPFLIYPSANYQSALNLCVMAAAVNKPCSPVVF